MTDPRPHDRDEELQALARWLAAEAAGRDSEAEAALGQLFVALPSRAPAPGLAARVMAEVATPPVVAVRRGGLWTAAAALLLALAGWGAALVGLTGGPAAGRLSPAELLSALAEGAVTGFRWVGEWAVTALDLFSVLRRLTGALTVAASAAPVATALVAALLVAAAALGALQQLIERDRRLSHVETA